MADEMRRIAFCLLITLLSAAWSAPSGPNPPGHQAYRNAIDRFWYGTATNGYLVSIAQQGGTFGQPAGNPGRMPIPFSAGNLWQYAMMGNVLYSYWKLTGSADAALRIASEWTWIQRMYAGGTDAACGVGTANVASDDSSWTSAFLMEIYEVTGDATALTHAKTLLDCAWTRWSDNGTAGCSSAPIAGAWIWYSDVCGQKCVCQSFALNNYWYYQLSADTTYRTRAINMDTWIAANMQRNGQTVNGNVYPNDGLYWITMNPSGTVSNVGTPYLIQPGSSVVMLAAEMAEAVLCARLYADTGDATYLTRLRSMALSIRTYQTSSGVAYDTRDPRGEGWAAMLYAREVVPLLIAANAFDANTIKASAAAVFVNNRSNDQTYGGSWNGPANGTDYWTGQGFYSQQVEITANAIMWPIAALAFQ